MEDKSPQISSDLFNKPFLKTLKCREITGKTHKFTKHNTNRTYILNILGYFEYTWVFSAYFLVFGLQDILTNLFRVQTF